jgi:hypothetical protein
VRYRGADRRDVRALTGRASAANLGEHIDGRTIIGPEQARDAFEAIRNSPTRAALRQLIADLEPATQLELIALAWIGRGGQEDDDTVTALERADRTNAPGDAADYLAGRTPLARYLRLGLRGLVRRPTRKDLIYLRQIASGKPLPTLPHPRAAS